MELPMEKLIKHLDPIHESVKSMAEKLLEEEKELMLYFYRESRKRENEYKTSDQFFQQTFKK